MNASTFRRIRFNLISVATSIMTPADEIATLKLIKDYMTISHQQVWSFLSKY